jgi:hypothetical protein
MRNEIMQCPIQKPMGSGGKRLVYLNVLNNTELSAAMTRSEFSAEDLPHRHCESIVRKGDTKFHAAFRRPSTLSPSAPLYLDIFPPGLSDFVPYSIHGGYLQKKGIQFALCPLLIQVPRLNARGSGTTPKRSYDKRSTASAHIPIPLCTIFTK